MVGGAERRRLAVAGGVTYRASNGTADRALRVLALFDDARPAITAADVARELGVARSTLFKRLKDWGLTRHEDENGDSQIFPSP